MIVLCDGFVDHLSSMIILEIVPSLLITKFNDSGRGSWCKSCSYHKRH